MKMAIEHFYPAISRTKISSVIYVGPERISNSYALQLREATSKLGVPLHLFAGGPLTPKFLEDFNRAIKTRAANDPSSRHMNEEVPILSNNNNNGNDDNNDDDDDDDDKMDDNPSTYTDACPNSLSSQQKALSNECLDFFTRLTQGARQSSRRGSSRHTTASPSSSSSTLNRKPKMGNFKKMKKIFTTNYTAKMKKKPSSTGRGVVTRAAARKRLSDVNAVAAAKPQTSSPGRPDPAIYTGAKIDAISTDETLPYKEMSETGKMATASVDRYFNEDASEGDPVSLTSVLSEDEGNLLFENERPCEFLPESLILIDDAFCHKASCLSSDANAKQRNNEYIKTLNFIQSLTQKYCHHYQWHLCITSQSPLSSAGTSAVAQMFRDIRTNLDSIALFNLIARDQQTLLQQIYSGETYNFVKQILQSLNGEFNEEPGDKRLHRPVLILGLNPSTNKALQFR